MKKEKITFMYSNNLFLKELLENLKQRFTIKTVEISTKTRKIPLPFRYYIPLKLKPHLRSKIIFVEWVSDILNHVAKKKRKGKVIVRCHRGDYFVNRKVVNWENVDKVIFVCKAMQRRFIEDYPEFKDKSTVIHNAINLDEFQEIKRKNTFDKRLATLGNINERKRVYDLILAFKGLLEKDKEFTLHIGGKGDEYQMKMHQELVKKLALDNKVFFYSYVDNKIEWLSSMDVIICNSVHESFNYTLHEGSLCGCYPLTHFWDGVEEFFPKENIYSTQEDFIEKVLEISKMENTTRKEKIGEINNKIVSNLNIDKIVNDFTNLILE
ncbi:MAG: glycosyltransferase [Candidatus Heimdallarchaeota archaeon]|nr:glycosyltransferase [Candidatus Heimdallarchaeota archaeon]